MSYYQEKLTELYLQKQILSAGATIMITELSADKKGMDFEKMSQILAAYNNAKETLDDRIDYFKNKIDEDESEYEHLKYMESMKED